MQRDVRSKFCYSCNYVAGIPRFVSQSETFVQCFAIITMVVGNGILMLMRWSDTKET